MSELILIKGLQDYVNQHILGLEGTYPLPEAQRERFLLQIKIGYPDAESEQNIVKLVLRQKQTIASLAADDFTSLSREAVLKARQAVLAVHLAEELETYMVQLVHACLDPGPYDKELGFWIAYGASPRGSIALALTFRAHAWLAGRRYYLADNNPGPGWTQLRSL